MTTNGQRSRCVVTGPSAFPRSGTITASRSHTLASGHTYVLAHPIRGSERPCFGARSESLRKRGSNNLHFPQTPCTADLNTEYAGRAYRIERVFAFRSSLLANCLGHARLPVRVVPLIDIVLFVPPGDNLTSKGGF